MGERAKRSYRSPRRERQADDTRRAILEAARTLFQERGYSGTTIEAVADRASVAPITVYATFGSKRAILDRLVAVSLVGDEAPTPLLEREGPQGVLKEQDQRRQVAMFAADIALIMERTGPLLEAMRNAAPSEPDIAERLDELLKQRMAGMRFFVDALARNGPLRRGVSLESAAETTWAMSSPDVHRLLTVRLGWPRERYVAWLTDVLTAVLVE